VPAALALAAPAAAGPSISGLHVHAIGARSAVVSWTTSAPATSVVEYGTTTAYGLWSKPVAARTRSHSVRLTALLPGRRYRVRAGSRGRGGLARRGGLSFVTSALSGARTSRVGAHKAILVDGQPVFPILQWLQCPSLFATNVELGVDAFMGRGCSNTDADEVARTAEQNAFSILDWAPGVKSARSLIGWHADDEPDGSGIRPAEVKQRLDRNRREDPHHLNFLTVTGDFFSAFDPPGWMNGNRNVYKQYAAAADVIGFDIYPVYGWCRPDWLHYVADAEHELSTIYAPRKPTYAWIEAVATHSQWCSGRPVSRSEVRAEVWMAIANGAKAIGYFTHSWTPTYSQFRVSNAVRAEMRRTNRQIGNLAAAILGMPVALSKSTTGGRIDAIARVHHGAVYVFAVNLSRKKVTGRFTSPLLRHRRLHVFEEGRFRTAGASGRFTDTFGPLAVHIYTVAPKGL
jgi:hypothetical protein